MSSSRAAEKRNPPPGLFSELSKGRGVIALIRLNGHPVMVNCDLIESLEETPDTVVTLTSGNKLVVRDSMAEVQRKIIEYKRKIYGPPEPSA
jgi:flagellar protein FlbD